MTHSRLKSIRETASTALDMLTLKYPGFVYGTDFRRDAIPVFCFHTVEYTSFETMLTFLDANGYRTLDADEYLSVLTGKAPIPEKAVLLTFDDGWSSLWTAGFPLIEKYGCKIVVFLPPGRIESLGGCRSSEDVADDWPHPLLSWEEIAIMHESRLVDFQSHSYSHGLVCRSAKIAGSVTPELLKAGNIFEFPLSPYTCGPIGCGQTAHVGDPIYESAPRLSDTPAFQVRSGQVESPDEQTSAIRFEFSESKRLIEEMLPGKVVRHMCYPWHVVGTIARRESRDAGYQACYWGKARGRYYSRIPGDPLRVARVGSDYFFRLPGKGRSSLMRILLAKFFRRVKQGSAYLSH